MRVEIITTNSALEIQDKVNAWLKEYPGYEVVSITHYSNMLSESYHSAPDTIANQWIEYITTILYNE